MPSIPVRDLQVGDVWPNKKAKVDEEKMGDESEVKGEEMNAEAEIESGEAEDKGEEEEESESDDEDDDDDPFEGEFYIGEVDEEVEEDYRLYRRKLTEEGPYAMEFFPRKGSFKICTVTPETVPEVYKRAEISAQYAVDRHNELTGSKLGFDSITRANFYLVAGYVFYLTLVATDPESGQNKTYQARVFDDLVHRRLELEKFLEVQ